MNFFRNSKMSSHRNRSRRDVMTALSGNMSLYINEIHKKIDDLQPAVNDSSQASCIVTSNGDVKCTNIVYNNPKVWKSSQNLVQKQILTLQAKLEKLKEIQKHLEIKRPNFDDNDDEEEEDDDRIDDQNKEDSVISLLTEHSQQQWTPR